MTISPIYTILIPVKRSGIPHGFPGQTFQVLPTELRGAMRLIPALCDFAFTDIGRYPRARRHYYRRSGGSEQHILILCESGSGSVKIEEREFTLEPDRFVIIPAGKPHEYWSSSSSPWTISWCHFQGLRGADFTCAAPVDQSPFAIDSDLITRVKSLFSMAFDIVERGYTLEHAAAASSLVHSILCLLIYDNTQLTPSRKPPRNRHVEKAIMFMGANIQRSISLNEIASHVGLSVSRLTQLFCSLVGAAPISYLTRERIYRACHYLDAAELPIADIARIVGYEDPFYFSRVFKRITGLSPRAYRQRSE